MILPGLPVNIRVRTLLGTYQRHIDKESYL